MKAFELLKDPNNWTKSLAVKLPEGKYDLASAVEKCYGEDNYIHMMQYLADMASIYFNKNFTRFGLINWNHSPKTTHSMVIDLLKKAGI